jgi:hypothetical protein
MTCVSAGAHVFATGSDTGVCVWPLRATGAYSAFFTTAPSAAAATASLASPTGLGMGMGLALPAVHGASASAAAGGYYQQQAGQQQQLQQQGGFTMLPNALRQPRSSAQIAAGALPGGGDGPSSSSSPGTGPAREGSAVELSAVRAAMMASYGTAGTQATVVPVSMAGAGSRSGVAGAGPGEDDAGSHAATPLLARTGPGF